MSILETQVDPIFQKLTTGTDIRLISPEEVDILARWTGKTAIVLGYVTPIPAIVPEFVRRSLLPDSPVPPQMRVFYAFIQAETTLEGGTCNFDMELIFRLSEAGASGYRFTICVFNH